MQTCSNHELTAIEYMPLPDQDAADVILHRDIQQAEDEDGNIIWTADEVQFRTSLTPDYIAEHFDEIFDAGGIITDPDTDEDVIIGNTLAERVQALEDKISELSDSMAIAMESVEKIETAISAGDIIAGDDILTAQPVEGGDDP